MSELDPTLIQTLIKNFYIKIQKDELLGPIFNDVAEVDWGEHIPVLTQFWNSVMLGTTEYSGNPMLKHIELSKKTDITLEHFDHWLDLFSQEAMTTLPPESAQLIIKRATLIASALKQRLLLD